MKSIKKVLSFLFLMILAISLVACSKKDKEEDKGDPDVGEEKVTDVALATSWSGKLSGKTVYLTCCGQADIAILSSILSNAGVASESVVTENQLTAKEVTDAATEGQVPAVILVVGASSKGLGAAGVDVASETARAEEFATAAKEGKIELIVAHVGGKARRGETSDPIIKAATPAAELLIVVLDGDSDNYFTNAAKTNSIELYLYKKTSGLVGAFKTLFGIE